MGNVVYGFLGIECYDLIHLLSRCYLVLGDSVAVADYSNDRSLAYSIPGLMENGTVEFDGILATTDRQEFDALRHQCGVVMAYLGKSLDYDTLNQCDEVFLITDSQKHNIHFLKEYSPQPEEQYHFLVLRNKVSNKVGIDYVNFELQHLGIGGEALIEMEEPPEDYLNRIALQHNTVKKVKRISKDVNDFILTALSGVYDAGAIKNAMKVVRGKLW